MARKRRGGRRGFRVGKWVNLAFKSAGATVAALPLITGVSNHIRDPQNIPVGVALEYGYDTTSGGINQSKLVGAISATIVGIAIMKIGGFISRRL